MSTKPAAEWVRIGDLLPWERNPKAHPTENVAEIARSIVRFGFTEPIIPWKSRKQVVAGHGRLLAAQMLYREDPGRKLAPDQPGEAATRRVALRDVVPDEVVRLTVGGQFFAQNANPGETGPDVMVRFGRKEGWYNVFMLHPDRPSQTLTKTYPGHGMCFHWTRRHISIREALVLTGFPASYILPGAFKDRWARIGNSVAPPMSREIVKQALGRIPA
jgi:site-specific DNA-cytosine methylase